MNKKDRIILRHDNNHTGQKGTEHMDIKSLVSRMTLEEKAGLCSGDDFWHTKAVERLGIPRSMVSDGPHGLRKQDEKADHLGINDSIKAVCFPTACATAASFDPELIRAIGGAIGDSCQHERVSVVLGPAVCAAGILNTSQRIPFLPDGWPRR